MTFQLFFHEEQVAQSCLNGGLLFGIPSTGTNLHEPALHKAACLPTQPAFLLRNAGQLCAFVHSPPMAGLVWHDALRTGLRPPGRIHTKSERFPGEAAITGPSALKG